MSRNKIGAPKRLPEKLKQVRQNLNLSQEGMFDQLGKVGTTDMVLYRGYITRYEAGSRIPSLLVLLAYSKIGKISVDSLIDDEVDI